MFGCSADVASVGLQYFGFKSVPRSAVSLYMEFEVWVYDLEYCSILASNIDLRHDLGPSLHPDSRFEIDLMLARNQ